MATADIFMKDISPVLQKCSIFSGIPASHYPDVLEFLHASKRSYGKGNNILNIGDHSHPAGLVIRGTLEASLLDENGGQINVSHIPAGGLFGLAIACSQKELSPIRLTAVSDCDLLFLDFSPVLNPGEVSDPLRNRISANLIRHMAGQMVFLNQRIRIIGQKKIRDKIKVFLQFQKGLPDGSIMIPFNRNELAEFLYADRSALSRELGRMSEEGILEYQGHFVRVLDPDFLKS